MAKGNREKDRTIDFLKGERGRLEQEVVTGAQKIAQHAAEIATLQKTVDALKAAAERPAPAAGGAAKPEQELKAPDGQRVTLPAIPARPQRPKAPKRLSTEDMLDDEKNKVYQEQLDKYDQAMEKYDQDEAAYQDAVVARAKVVDELVDGKIGEVRTLRDKLSAAEKRIEDMDAGVKEVRTTVGRQAAADAAVEQTMREYAEVDAYRSQHPEIYTSERSVQDIERETLDFMRELAGGLGIAGGIYMPDGKQLKPEVWDAFQTFMNDKDSEEGKRIVDLMAVRQAAPPEDFDDLEKTWRVRSYRTRYSAKDGEGKFRHLSYAEAHRMAVADHEDLRNTEPRAAEAAPAAAPAAAPSAKPAAPAAQPRAKADERMAEVEARERAAKARQGFAPEPDTTKGGADINMEDPNVVHALGVIFAKKPGERTEQDRQLIRAVCATVPGLSEKEFDS